MVAPEQSHCPQTGLGRCSFSLNPKAENQETQVPVRAQEKTNVPAQTPRRRMLSSSPICSSQGLLCVWSPPTLRDQSVSLNLQVQMLPLSRNTPQTGPLLPGNV